MLKISIISLILLLPFYGFTQETDIELGVQTQTGLSYTGWRQSFNLQLSKNSHTVYLGPGVSLSDAYLPHRSSLGWQTGYYYVFENNNRFINTAGIHLQALYGQSAGETTPQTYEVFLHYGLGVKFKSFQIVNTLGFGGYVERFYNFGFSEKQTLGGFNFMPGLMINYTF